MVANKYAESFGGMGSTWGGLTVLLWGFVIEVATVGNGTVEGAGSFEAGSSVTLTATPEHGLHFIGWTGDATGLTNPLSLISDREMNIEAIFLDLASYDLVTQASYDAVVVERDNAVTERDARPTQASYDAAVATARTDGRGDVSGDPASYDLVTQASYDAVVVERDARPTLQEVRDGRPGSVLLSVDSEAVSVVLDFTVEESEDLITWTPVAGPGVSQTLTLPEGKRFYRFAH